MLKSVCRVCLYVQAAGKWCVQLFNMMTMMMMMLWWWWVSTVQPSDMFSSAAAAAISPSTSSARQQGHTDVSFLIIIISAECGVVTFSVASVCVSVCLSVCNSLTFESLDLESSFLVCRYDFQISVSSSYVKVIGSRSKSRERKECAYVSCSPVSAFNWVWNFEKVIAAKTFTTLAKLFRLWLHVKWKSFESF